MIPYRHIALHVVQQTVHGAVEVNDNWLAVGTIIEVNVDVVAGIRHVNDVLAMKGVDGFSEGCAGLLGAEAVLVVLEGNGLAGLAHLGQLAAVLPDMVGLLNALWRFLDGQHGVTCFQYRWLT